MYDGRYKVAFVMPSKYKSSKELPKPKNAAVQLKDIPAHTLAAISWRSVHQSSYRVCVPNVPSPLIPMICPPLEGQFRLAGISFIFL